MTSKDILTMAQNRQEDTTDQSKNYAVFYGKEHDLLIALPHSEKLTKNFKIYFSKEQSKYTIITIYSGQHAYKVLFNDNQILFNENGYYAIMGRYSNQKGLHKQPLHKLAYIAFFGNPPPGYHIHHIDKDKHNNSMNNLVAVSEAEHEQIHQHPVSVGRNLFNKPPQQTLLSELKKESALSSSSSNSKYEESLMAQIEELVEVPVSELLASSPTKANLDELVSRVVVEGCDSVLVFLCKLYMAVEPVVDSLSRD